MHSGGCRNSKFRNPPEVWRGLGRRFPGFDRGSIRGFAAWPLGGALACGSSASAGPPAVMDAAWTVRAGPQEAGPAEPSSCAQIPAVRSPPCFHGQEYSKMAGAEETTATTGGRFAASGWLGPAWRSRIAPGCSAWRIRWLHRRHPRPGCGSWRRSCSVC